MRRGRHMGLLGYANGGEVRSAPQGNYGWQTVDGRPQLVAQERTPVRSIYADTGGRYIPKKLLGPGLLAQQPGGTGGGGGSNTIGGPIGESGAGAIETLGGDLAYDTALEMENAQEIADIIEAGGINEATGDPNIVAGPNALSAADDGIGGDYAEEFQENYQAQSDHAAANPQGQTTGTPIYDQGYGAGESFLGEALNTGPLGTAINAVTGETILPTYDDLLPPTGEEGSGGVSGFLTDLVDGGGIGASGDTFEGPGIVDNILNTVGVTPLGSQEEEPVGPTQEPDAEPLTYNVVQTQSGKSPSWRHPFGRASQYKVVFSDGTEQGGFGSGEAESWAQNWVANNSAGPAAAAPSGGSGGGGGSDSGSSWNPGAGSASGSAVLDAGGFGSGSNNAGTGSDWGSSWTGGFAEGGEIPMSKGLLDRKSEDVTVTRKMGNGASITYKSPMDSQMDLNGILGGMVDGYAPSPVADNKQINVTPGEFVVNQPAAQKYSGLLEQINNEGRQALKMGGWTTPKGKMNYANGGGVFDGYGNYSQQQFLDEAQPRGVQGGSAAPGVGQQAPEWNQTFEQATPEDLKIAQATTPVQAQPPVNQQIQPLGPEAAQPEQPPEVDPRPAMMVNDAVAKTTAADLHKELSGKTDTNTAKALSDVIGDSSGISDALALLDQGIEKQESKRDSMKLLFGSLALLSGSGVEGAARAANQVGGFNAKRIDELYAQRRVIQDQITKATLGVASEGKEFGVGWTGDDGQVYFSPDEVPEGVKITGKAGTSNPDVPTKWVTSQTKAAEDIQSIDERRAKISNVLSDVPDKVWSGIFGAGAASLNKILGTQGEVDTWRTNVTALRNEVAIGDLPPGVASDRDIELVLKGTPDSFANPEALRDYLRGVEKLANYQKRYKQAYIDYIEENHTISGFEAPEYQPSGADQATIGVTTSSATPSNYDFDFSQ